MTSVSLPDAAVERIRLDYARGRSLGAIARARSDLAAQRGDVAAHVSNLGVEFGHLRAKLIDLLGDVRTQFRDLFRERREMLCEKIDALLKLL